MDTVGEVITCKAAVVKAAGEKFEILDILVDPPQKGEVRIKILFCAPCHTDQLTQRGVDPQGLYPCILGHEAAGVVESIGPDVTTCKPGDCVIPCWLPECFPEDQREGSCRTCVGAGKNKTNLCGKLLKEIVGGFMRTDGKSRFHLLDGTSLYHFMGVSCFSQYTVVHQESVAVIPSDAPLDRVCLLGCGVSTGMGAAINTANVQAGSTVAVFGLGAVGLACVEGSRLAGASEIICVDKSPKKLSLASMFGGTQFLNTNDFDKPMQDVIQELTNGGVDYSFDCTGNTDVMQSALESTCKGWGVSVIVGIGEAGHEVHARPYHMIVGRTWKGTVFGGYKGRSDLPKLVKRQMAGELELEKYVTHTLPFDQINEAFDMLSKAECIRCILKMF